MSRVKYSQDDLLDLELEVRELKRELEEHRTQLFKSIQPGQLWGGVFCYPDQATLAGKVDAIIEYLGITVAVEPEKVTAAKVSVKKGKK